MRCEAFMDQQELPRPSKYKVNNFFLNQCLAWNKYFLNQRVMVAKEERKAGSRMRRPGLYSPTLTLVTWL